MAEILNQIARCREIVPIESWSENGVDGWRFRESDNNLVFIPTSELREQLVRG